LTGRVIREWLVVDPEVDLGELLAVNLVIVYVDALAICGVRARIDCDYNCGVFLIKSTALQDFGHIQVRYA